MTDLRKAAEMALEVMEYNRANGTPNMGAAIEALRQALAQPVDAVNMTQESVDKTEKGEHEPFIYVREDNERPFGGYEHCSEADAGAFPVYTAPPKKEWVGLTRRELDIATLGLEDLSDCYKAIEAKLKEKNT